MLSSITIRHIGFGCMLCFVLPWVRAAETRIAIVPASSQAELELAVQLATVVLNDASGIRLLDTTVDGATPEAMSTSVAGGVRQAVAKYRAPPGEVQTVSVLTLRNADLPRSFDASVGADIALTWQPTRPPNCFNSTPPGRGCSVPLRS